MNIRYRHMKEAVYIMMAAMGFLLLVAGANFMNSAGYSPDPFACYLPAAILIVGGVLSMFFAFVTFLLRDDPDVWR